MSRFFKFLKFFLKHVIMVSGVILLILAYFTIIVFFAEWQCYYFGFKDKIGVVLANLCFITISILISLVAWEEAK